MFFPVEHWTERNQSDGRIHRIRYGSRPALRRCHQRKKIGSAVDTSELEQQADAIKAQLRQRLSTKSRLEHQMDTLDF